MQYSYFDVHDVVLVILFGQFCYNQISAFLKVLTQIPLAAILLISTYVDVVQSCFVGRLGFSFFVDVSASLKSLSSAFFKP